MDYKIEFIPVLEKTLYKKGKIDEITLTSSILYMLNRYITFYDTALVPIINNINKISNKDFEPEYLREITEAILPILPKKYIKYQSKKIPKELNDVKDFVKSYSRKHNISEEKVFQQLYNLQYVNS